MTSVVLRPLLEEDVVVLYEWSLSPDVARTWRFRGTTPPPEVFRARLWDGVLCHFMCVRRQDPLPIGYVSLYDANLAALNVKLSCIVAPELRFGRNAVDCVLAILGFAFSQWPFDRVLMECNSVSIRQFESAVERGLMREEARLRQYERFGDGEWVDLVWLSAERATFDAQAARLSSGR